MAAGSMVVVVPSISSAAIARTGSSRLNFSAICHASSSSSFRLSCEEINAGTGPRSRSFSDLRRRAGGVVGCLSSDSSSSSPSFSSSSRSRPKTKLYVSGLSFRTTEESLRNAFERFGELVDVNLVMDKLANRPRGFAFLRYATEEESMKAIEGMHGKFLDGRVIFVEVAKSRSELQKAQPERVKKVDVSKLL